MRRLCFAERAHATLSPADVLRVLRDGALLSACGLSPADTTACEDTVGRLCAGVCGGTAADPAGGGGGGGGADSGAAGKGVGPAGGRRRRPNGKQRASSPKRPINRFSLLCDASSGSDVGEPL